MARMLPKSLFLRGSVLHHHSSSFLRHRSSKPELIEIDLDPSSSSPAAVLDKMEEMIHSILVQKSTPLWLPFLPGSSFWVPLPPHYGSKRVSKFVEQLTNQLSVEESLALTSGRGWPCSSFFLPDGDSADAASMDVEEEISEREGGDVKVEFWIDSDKKSF